MRVKNISGDLFIQSAIFNAIHINFIWFGKDKMRRGLRLDSNILWYPNDYIQIQNLILGENGALTGHTPPITYS